MREDYLKNMAGIMRAPFLILTPACVFLGIAISLWKEGAIDYMHAFIAFLGAAAAHISVNALNEYFDFKNGLDFRTIRTPFSGGSGTLPKNPRLASWSLFAGLAAFIIVCLVGVYFIIVRGWLILPLGFAGLLLIALYTPVFTKSPFMCLIAPGLGFGPLMVMGTDFVLTGFYSAAAMVASLVPFFLVCNLLLLNQFPDIEADKSVNRRNIPIQFGTGTGSVIYGLFMLLAYASILCGVFLVNMPAPTLAGLFTIPLALFAFLGAYRYGRDRKRLLPYLGLNVIIIILTPLLVGIGVLTG